MKKTIFPVCVLLLILPTFGCNHSDEPPAGFTGVWKLESEAPGRWHLLTTYMNGQKHGLESRWDDGYISVERDYKNNRLMAEREYLRPGLISFISREHLFSYKGNDQYSCFISYAYSFSIKTDYTGRGDVPESVGFVGPNNAECSVDEFCEVAKEQLSPVAIEGIRALYAKYQQSRAKEKTP